MTPDPPLPRPVVLGLAVLTVVVVGALSLVLFRDDLARTGDDGDLTAASEVTRRDDFDRPDADRLATGDLAWSDLVGRWVVQDGHAALVEAGSGAVAGLTALDRDRADGVVSAVTRAVEPGWGLAFRVAGPDDFWAVVARESDWAVVRVEAGTVLEAGPVVATPPEDGLTVEVRLRATTIEVSVGGATAEPLDDDALADAGSVGFVSLSGTGIASMAWDDLQVGP